MGDLGLVYCKTGGSLSVKYWFYRQTSAADIYAIKTKPYLGFLKHDYTRINTRMVWELRTVIDLHEIGLRSNIRPKELRLGVLSIVDIVAASS